MRLYSRWFCTLLLPCILLASCGGNSGSPDLSSVKVTFSSADFYKDFSAIDTGNIEAGLTELNKKYPDFLTFYLDDLVGLHTNGNFSDTVQGLKFFMTYKDFRNLFDTVNKVFPDKQVLDAQLTDLFQHIRHYDSSFSIPEKVYYYAAGLNLAVFTRENTLGIGLDMFLGRNFKPYEQVGIPEYRTTRHTPENIPVAAAKAIYEERFPVNYDDKNLLELMVQQGKELYFMKNVLPEANDSLLLGFTTEQMKWCNENEALIYNFFIQQQFLYETDQKKVVRYIVDGPSAAGMPPESPGSVGSFTGLKIVTQYAKNTGASLEEVLTENDAKKILTGAEYKP